MRVGREKGNRREGNQSIWDRNDEMVEKGLMKKYKRKGSKEKEKNSEMDKSRTRALHVLLADR